MFTHTINYVDFNGTERTEDLHFHLSLPEVARLEAEIGEPLTDYTKKIAAEMDLPKLLAFLEKMVLTSYGKKSLDGKTFHKSKELRSEFENSNAYAELFEELLTNPELAKKFGEGIATTGKARKRMTEGPKVVN